MDGTVLIADDDRSIRTVLTQAFTRAGCRAHATGSLATLLRWVEEGRGDLVISDVVMPDGNGLEALEVISRRRPDLPVIVISAQNTIVTAIRAAERQAWDYLPKPFDLPALMKLSRRALEWRQERRRESSAPGAGEGPGARRGPDLPLVGRSEAMQALYRDVARLLNVSLPVLVIGESGTGKSLLARALHDLSERAETPFEILRAHPRLRAEEVTAAVARAAGGTLVVEELTELPADAQLTLLQALEGQAGAAARIVATSQQPPAVQVEAGRLRADLFYRLDGAVLTIPPLRDRPQDVPLLVGHFLGRITAETAQPLEVEDAAMERLRRYHWPGNVRQLENLVTALAARARGGRIEADAVEALLGAQPGAACALGLEAGSLGEAVAHHLRRYFEMHGAELPPPGLHGRVLREVEGPLLELALEATGGNQIRAAEILGISRNTLRKKLGELGISVRRVRRLR